MNEVIDSISNHTIARTLHPQTQHSVAVVAEEAEEAEEED